MKAIEETKPRCEHAVTVDCGPTYYDAERLHRLYACDKAAKVRGKYKLLCSSPCSEEDGGNCGINAEVVTEPCPRQEQNEDGMYSCRWNGKHVFCSKETWNSPCQYNRPEPVYELIVKKGGFVGAMPTYPVKGTKRERKND